MVMIAGAGRLVARAFGDDVTAQRSNTGIATAGEAVQSRRDALDLFARPANPFPDLAPLDF